MKVYVQMLPSYLQFMTKTEKFGGNYGIPKEAQLNADFRTV